MSYLIKKKRQFRTVVLAGLVYMIMESKLAEGLDLPPVDKEHVQEWYENATGLFVRIAGGRDGDEFERVVLVGLIYLLSESRLAKNAGVKTPCEEQILEWIKNAARIMKRTIKQSGSITEAGTNGKKYN